MRDIIYSLLLVLAGIFSVVCAAFDFDWFMNHRKAQFISKRIGRMGARIFFIVLGVIIIGFGTVSWYFIKKS
ncbi:MAG: Imm17 family immunity protein [Spirochaetia bacterium]|jgi:hypothetical protein|nr:Imm17 family immunity protein [Spirochaetia bacterium]